MKPGDVVVGMLPGAMETKVRPAVIIASDDYLRERPDVPPRPSSTDYVLKDWQAAGLRSESCFRAFVLTLHRSHLTAIGHLSDLDWSSVQACVRRAFAL